MRAATIISNQNRLKGCRLDPTSTVRTITWEEVAWKVRASPRVKVEEWAWLGVMILNLSLAQCTIVWICASSQEFSSQKPLSFKRWDPFGSLRLPCRRWSVYWCQKPTALEILFWKRMPIKSLASLINSRYAFLSSFKFRKKWLSALEKLKIQEKRCIRLRNRWYAWKTRWLTRGTKITMDSEQAIMLLIQN